MLELVTSIRENYEYTLNQMGDAAQKSNRNPNEIRLVVVTKSQPSGVEWHMIGHVQSRKARLVADHFALLHSLDSLKLAQRLNRFAAERNRVLPALLEFNVGGEESKFGWNARDASQWHALLPDVSSILDLPNLRLHGLMTMPPLGTAPEDSRRFFLRLRLLRDHLASQFPKADWHELSMGTSADYAVAVEEGATLVRVGTAIVGARKHKLDAEREA